MMYEVIAIFCFASVCFQTLFFLNCLNSRRREEKRFIKFFYNAERGFLKKLSKDGRFNNKSESSLNIENEIDNSPIYNKKLFKDKIKIKNFKPSDATDEKPFHSRFSFPSDGESTPGLPPPVFSFKFQKHNYDKFRNALRKILSSELSQEESNGIREKGLSFENIYELRKSDKEYNKGSPCFPCFMQRSSSEGDIYWQLRKKAILEELGETDSFSFTESNRSEEFCAALLEREKEGSTSDNSEKDVNDQLVAHTQSDHINFNLPDIHPSKELSIKPIGQEVASPVHHFDKEAPNNSDEEISDLFLKEDSEEPSVNCSPHPANLLQTISEILNSPPNSLITVKSKEHKSEVGNHISLPDSKPTSSKEEKSTKIFQSDNQISTNIDIITRNSNRFSIRSTITLEPDNNKKNNSTPRDMNSHVSNSQNQNNDLNKSLDDHNIPRRPEKPSKQSDHEGQSENGFRAQSSGEFKRKLSESMEFSYERKVAPFPKEEERNLQNNVDSGLCSGEKCFCNDKSIIRFQYNQSEDMEGVVMKHSICASSKTSVIDSFCGKSVINSEHSLCRVVEKKHPNCFTIKINNNGGSDQCVNNRNVNDLYSFTKNAQNINDNHENNIDETDDKFIGKNNGNDSNNNSETCQSNSCVQEQNKTENELSSSYSEPNKVYEPLTDFKNCAEENRGERRKESRSSSSEDESVTSDLSSFSEGGNSEGNGHVVDRKAENEVKKERTEVEGRSPRASKERIEISKREQQVIQGLDDLIADYDDGACSEKSDEMRATSCQEPSKCGDQPPSTSSSSSEFAEHKTVSRTASEPAQNKSPPPPPPPPPVGSSTEDIDSNKNEKQTIERSQSLPAQSLEFGEEEDSSEKFSSSSGGKALPFILPKFHSQPSGHGLIKPSEYLKSLTDHSEVSLPSIPETKEEDSGSLIPPPPPPPTSSPSPPPSMSSTINANNSASSHKPGLAGAKMTMPTISVTDLQSVQLRKTESKILKPTTVPLKIHTEQDLVTQRNDVIAELKMGVDIDGIKKLKTEKIKEEIHIVEKEKEELKKQFVVDKFVEKVPEVDGTGNPIPQWKRQMLAKKAAEKAKKEAEEKKQKELEERRLQSIPAWKRQLLAKKEEERQRSQVPVVGTGSSLRTLQPPSIVKL